MSEHILVLSNNCKGCHRCEIACIAAHNDMSLKEATKVREQYTPRVHVVATEEFKTTVRCHQCDNAPCSLICPTGAIRQAETGDIIMNRSLCMGCGMCINACPYGAIQLENNEVIMPGNLRLGANISGAACSIEKSPTGVYGPAEEPAMPAVQHFKAAVRCDMCKDWRKANNKEYTACMEACLARSLVLQKDDGTIVFPPTKEKPAKAAAK